MTESIKIATFVRDVSEQNGATGEQRLYRLDPPMDGVEFVITSAVNHSWAHETYLFPADEDGAIVDWGELEGSYRGDTDHERALRGAGYEVQS
ncbi:hypothetical protein [Microbacterium maritypicum]